LKIALCFAPDGSDPMPIVGKVAEAQTLREFHRCHTFSVPNGAAVAVRAADQFSAISMLRQGIQGNWVMVSGVPIVLGGSVDNLLDRVVGGDYESASRLLPTMDGAFAAAFWDAVKEKLVVVTDFLGMQPLYMYRDSQWFLMATEVKGITGSGVADFCLDPGGAGCLYTVGHLVGHETVVKGVVRVPAGSVWIYDARARSLERSTYWSWPPPQPRMGLADVDIAGILDVLRQEVRAYADHYQPGTVLLSGGFDSRLILALLEAEGFPSEALILAHQDEVWGVDSRLAAKAADVLGVRYSLVEPPRSFYSTKAYSDYLLSSEVLTPSLYLFIAQVAASVSPGLGAVWEGVGPGYGLVPPHQPEGGFASYLAQEQVPEHSRVWEALRFVFARPFMEEMCEEQARVLRAEAKKYPDDGFGVSEFVVRNRMRNRTGPNPFKVYANDVLALTPGLSKAFWSAVGSIPYGLKSGHNLYLEIFRRYFPEVGKIPFWSGAKLRLLTRSRLRGCFAQVVNGLVRSQHVRRVQSIIRQVMTGSWRYWTDTDFIRGVCLRVDGDHPDLKHEAVESLKKYPPSYVTQRTAYYAQQALFYWQMWEWLVSGCLASKCSDLSSQQQNGRVP